MSQPSLASALESIRNLNSFLPGLRDSFHKSAIPAKTLERFVSEAGELCDILNSIRQEISPERFGPIGITLGRSDSIAKFFAFSFASRETVPLETLKSGSFFGSGVYAIY